MKLRKTIAALLSMLLLAYTLTACGIAGDTNLQGTKCDFVSVATGGNTLTLAQMNGLGQAAPTISFEKNDFTLNAFGGIIYSNYKKIDDKSYTIYVINEETKAEEKVGKITIDSDNQIHILFSHESIGSQEYIFVITE